MVLSNDDHNKLDELLAMLPSIDEEIKRAEIAGVDVTTLRERKVKVESDMRRIQQAFPRQGRRRGRATN